MYGDIKKQMNITLLDRQASYVLPGCFALYLILLVSLLSAPYELTPILLRSQGVALEQIQNHDHAKYMYYMIFGCVAISFFKVVIQVIRLILMRFDKDSRYDSTFRVQSAYLVVVTMLFTSNLASFFATYFRDDLVFDAVG